MQASDDLAKLKEQLLYSLSLTSAVTEKPDQLLNAIISEVNDDADSERHVNDTDSDREDDDVNSNREKNDVTVKKHTAELSSIFSDSFCCCVS